MGIVPIALVGRTLWPPTPGAALQFWAATRAAPTSNRDTTLGPGLRVYEAGLAVRCPDEAPGPAAVLC